MSAVIEPLKRIIAIQKSLGYNMEEYLRPGLSVEEIRRLGSRYDFEFNFEFQEYLKFSDGISLPNEFVDSNWVFAPPLFRLASSSVIESFIKEKVFYEIKYSYAGTEEISLKHYPIIYESHVNCYWVNLDKEDKKYGHVLETTMWGDIQYVYSSISRLFFTYCEAYQRGCIFMNDGELDIDFKRFGQIAKKLNPEIDYWKTYI